MLERRLAIGQPRRRTCSLLAAASALLLAGCAASAPVTPSPPMPAASVPASSPPPAATSPSPSPSPSGSASGSAWDVVARLPMGHVVVDRLVDSTEGDFAGAFILGPDGSETEVDLPVKNLGFGGIWSPEGDRLLVNAFTGDQLIVGVLDPETEAFTQIRAKGMTGELECTDWTPDARQVICGRGGSSPADDGIYEVDVDSGEAVRLTTSPYHHVVGTAGECGGGEGRAVVSPDASRFAYIQQKCGRGADPSRDEEGAIVVAASDGTGQEVIVPYGGVRTHPGGEISWSPTDDLIAFGTQDGKLSVIGADGEGLRTLEMPGHAYGPTWSPDGTWLLVSVARPHGDDLFVVAADGSTTFRITDTPVVEAFTDWGPIP
jgi:WD40 repeat protein